MITTSGITMQFGDKPLFENISVKFGDGNRYGLIGANGCGKSTFMKILGGDLVPTSGSVSIDQNERLGKLRQDHFAFEDCTVLDTVMMGFEKLWRIKVERDQIYAKAEFTDEDGMRAGHLESEFADLDGYSAEANAGELLISMGIPVEIHFNLMKSIAPGWKLRVLLAQALFGDPEIILLDEPTNHMDMEFIEALNCALERYKGTLIFVSHDREFVSSLATRIIELTPEGIVDYHGTYEEYLKSQGIAL